MLEVKNITKVYKTANYTQKALDGVSVKFRKNEFVSILGPSGSGKTTLLNIIGGLDQYDSGDLIINGISTKKYKDRNWDSYRNHRVGFIFQNYNLISHQTILRNVELALTLSGVSKGERVKKAKEALAEVGLEEHIHKRPNQLSGGQMQRVAIARALINDPDILLADEPTGALDSKTSVQIMELLKNIAKKKLVIMVTHNPELANEYSTRIIKIHDGQIEGDTNPLEGGRNVSEDDLKKNKKSKKTTMGILTAFGLSLNNLLTKKGRTILTAFAGSIGIIGIALILSLSNGFQNYIDKLQEDTLSSYPLTISSETMDFTSMLLSMMDQEEKDKTEEEMVKESQRFTEMFSNIKTNNLRDFKSYIEKNNDKLKNDVSAVSYMYSIDPLIYTKDKDKKILQVNPNSIFSSLYGGNNMMSSYSSFSSVFVQMPPDKNKLNENYEVLKGNWPTNYDEMVLVLPNKNSIPDLILYLVGLRDINELYDIMSKVMSGESVDINNEPLEFSYDDFLNLEFKMLYATDLYKYNEKYNIYEDMKEDKDYIKNLYKDALNLKIVGIVAPKESSNSMSLTTGIIYSPDLIKNIIDHASKSEIVKKQLKDDKVDVFSDTRFDDKNKKTGLEFEDLITVDQKKIESAFTMKFGEKDIKKLTTNYINQINKSLDPDPSVIKKTLSANLKTITLGMISDYVENTPNKLAGNAIIYTNDIDKMVDEYLEKNSVSELNKELEKKYLVPGKAYNELYSSLIKGMLKTYIVTYNQMDKSLTTDPLNPAAIISNDIAKSTIDKFTSSAEVAVAFETLSVKMVEAKMKSEVLTKVGEMSGELVTKMATSLNVDPERIASAFKFDLSEDELRRLMSAMMNDNDSNQKTNLISLGYQDIEEPTFMQIYFNSFTGKENFMSFIDKYNDNALDEDKINYTDTTGILMSSVKKIVDSVSYVLIAFVSISLVVSSIMIGVITYISVLERTKEIGILRAIGASKRNISNIFNAETFIVGLLAGLIGIGFTLAVIPPINNLIHSLTDNYNINAALPVMASVILIALSVILTLIGGLIPSKLASKKDPVSALRTE